MLAPAKQGRNNSTNTPHMLPTTQTRTNLTTASAVIKYCEVPDALAAQVAAQQGVTLSTPGVTWTCCHNADGYHVIVTVDHEARGDTPASPNPALRANAIQAAAQQAAEANTPYWQQYATGLGDGQGFLGSGVNQETSQQLQDRLSHEYTFAEVDKRFTVTDATRPPTQQQPPMTLPERIERDKQRTAALRNLADAFHQGRAAPTSPSAVGYVEALVAAAERALGDPTEATSPPPQKAPWPFPPNPAPNDYGRR